jgi:hypothetical protein
VFVRPLSMDEGRKVQRITRTARIRSGCEALNPKRSGGRRKRIGVQLRSWICTIARTSRADSDITGFSTWSLTKLRDHLLDEGIVAELSRETLIRTWTEHPAKAA